MPWQPVFDVIPIHLWLNSEPAQFIYSVTLWCHFKEETTSWVTLNFGRSFLYFGGRITFLVFLTPGPEADRISAFSSGAKLDILMMCVYFYCH